MPEPRSSESPKPLSWSEWKAQNGSKRWYWRIPLEVEWALEWFVYRLRSMALFELLELAGKLTVVVAVIFWFLEADNRAKQSHYRAWELINSARGSTGDGGRRDALQDLSKDGVSLSAAPLEKAYLLGADLRWARLTGANLQDANLASANLQGAVLEDANLRDANLANANLQGANLQGANLQGANLQGAGLSDANLQDDTRAILRHFGLKAKRMVLRAAFSEGVDLQDADLSEANLQDAKLIGADLRGADLSEANLQGANLRDAILMDARNLTQEQLDAAIGNHRTQLPAGLSRPAHWPKTEIEDLLAPQPDDAGRAPAADGAPGSGK